MGGAMSRSSCSGCNTSCCSEVGIVRCGSFVDPQRFAMTTPAPASGASDSPRPDGPPPSLRPETWLEAYGDRLFRYAFARLHDREAAEDAVQDALLAAVNACDTFDGRSTESTWLFGILRHKVYDALRRRSREADWRRQLTEQADPTGASCVHTGPWPREAMGATERDEFAAALRAAIDRLPAGMREAFFLSEIDGIGSSEVCAILDISSANLWTLRYRARQRLRQDLDERWFRRDDADRPVLAGETRDQ